MKIKYTIIYTESWMSGSHRQTQVRMMRAERNKNETVAEMLKRHDLYNVNFIFEGHPKREGEIK